jgi:hypothetical protein
VLCVFGVTCTPRWGGAPGFCGRPRGGARPACVFCCHVRLLLVVVGMPQSPEEVVSQGYRRVVRWSVKGAGRCAIMSCGRVGRLVRWWPACSQSVSLYAMPTTCSSEHAAQRGCRLRCLGGRGGGRRRRRGGVVCSLRRRLDSLGRSLGLGSGLRLLLLRDLGRLRAQSSRGGKGGVSRHAGETMRRWGRPHPEAPSMCACGQADEGAVCACIGHGARRREGVGRVLMW